MPWQQADPVNERLKFVVAAQDGPFSITELCRRFGISRKTGYKLLARYESDGPEGMRDRSRAPASHPNRTSVEFEAAVLRVRKVHATWGSKKILAILARDHAPGELPARSTVDQILKRAGLVVPRRKRARRQPSAPPTVKAEAANDVWTIDYKGWFRVGDGTRCDPLTINDAYSRISLECRAMVSPKLGDVKRRLEATFWEYGLPTYLLSDNGPPFASQGLGHLSRLGVWLLRLGVQPVFIEPGHPEQDGRYERFHETLKAETANPPRSSIRAQQVAFQSFQREYNEERPHEALDMRVPADLYVTSTRSMPTSIADHEYADGIEPRHVRRDGAMKWAGGLVFVGEAMAHELVGLERIDEDRWHVHLGAMRLGVLHARSRTVPPALAEGQ